jgi:hypothetical protein
LEIGLSIIFAGDFRQPDTIYSKESELLFSSKSTQQRDQNINTIIILDNKHSFQDDSEYGKMLNRL